MSSLYYDLVPKDPVENLEWRIRCRERALVDERFRSALLQACETDVLFFFAFALWVHEPRAKVKTKPFIPWKHQEAVILAMDEAITEAMATEHPVSVTLKKSRAQGGTYTYLGVQIRRALTEKGFSSGLVTRNEKTVDSKDPSAVMNKLSDMLDKLPVWMMDGKPYERNITDHTIRIPKTDAIWIGYSATADVARGGRTTLFAFDEVGSEEFIANGIDYRIMSSVAHVTNCIFLCSTFGADTGVFYESATDPDNTRVYALDWKENPEHAKLAYIKKDGVVTAINPDEQEQVEKYVSSHERELRAIERRGHKIEGKFRSPWYDSHCLLPGATPRYIARELDMDAKGSSGKVFSPDLLDRMKKNHGKKPVWRGTPIFDSETLEFKGLVPRDDGPLSLWFKPGIDNSPPLGPFAIACDIASGGVGAYSSNSVASGIDYRTGEEILEYVIKGLEPRPFARMVVGLCLWMRKALLGWEDSGVSGGFAKEVVEVCNYGNVFYRDVTQLGSQKKSRKAGFPCRDADKADMFEQFALAMEKGDYTPRSEEMLKECGEYEWENGRIIHSPTKNKGATEKNHGDRAIAAAGAWLVFSGENLDSKVDSDIENGQIPEYGSFLWRERQERQVVSSGSPKFGIRDVLR
jgi:hypothetical protein